jgi:hypothetical protein
MNQKDIRNADISPNWWYMRSIADRPKMSKIRSLRSLILLIFAAGLHPRDSLVHSLRSRTSPIGGVIIRSWSQYNLRGVKKWG